VTATVCRFDLTLEGVELGANMLPSSIVRYTTEAITGKGVLGRDSTFFIELPKHAVHFRSAVSEMKRIVFLN